MVLQPVGTPQISQTPYILRHRRCNSICVHQCRAGLSSPLSILNSNVQSLKRKPLPMWCGNMAGMDAVISRPRTLRSSPAPSSSPSSGCASSAEVSSADGPWITVPCYPALSVGTAAPPPPPPSSSPSSSSSSSFTTSSSLLFLPLSPQVHNKTRVRN